MQQNPQHSPESLPLIIIEEIKKVEEFTQKSIDSYQQARTLADTKFLFNAFYYFSIAIAGYRYVFRRLNLRSHISCDHHLFKRAIIDKLDTLDHIITENYLFFEEYSDEIDLHRQLPRG